ncbi:MAG: HEAT repeat domain-containing protein, partial [Gemmataceae bacterium]|nr:HEAT repeat domain-containing protein [Gemmataceae bacterium]
MLASQPLSDTPSLTILGTLLGLVALVGLLAALGFVQPVVQGVAWLLRDIVRRGFLLWERTLGWMPWPLFAAFAAAGLALGIWADDSAAVLALAAALALYSGIVAVLAYIHLDFERVEVERGYKALHSPEQGQQLAHDYIRHGHRAPWPMLAAAALAFVGGFALLNKALWLGPGRAWYDLQGLPGSVADFAAYSVISLYNAVDLLDIAQKQRLFQLPHVAAAAWPARTLLVVYKAFFAFVLVQQLLSALRRSGQMGQVVRDFWNPNQVIHGRAKTTVPLFGAEAVGPLLRSLAEASKVTREMRDELPDLLAAAGPAAIPALVRRLRDPNEHVRIVAAGALGRLGGRRTLAKLVPLAGDPSDSVRQAVAEAIGRIASPRVDHLEERGIWSMLLGWLTPRGEAMRRALAALVAGTKDRAG